MELVEGNLIKSFLFLNLRCWVFIVVMVVSLNFLLQKITYIRIDIIDCVSVEASFLVFEVGEVGVGELSTP